MPLIKEKSWKRSANTLIYWDSNLSLKLMLIFMLFHTDFSRPFLLQSVILFTHSIRLFKSTPRTGSLYVTNLYLHTLGKLLLLLKYSYLFILKLRSKTVFIHKIHESYIQKIWRNSLKLQNMQGQQDHRKQDQYTK